MNDISSKLSSLPELNNNQPEASLGSLDNYRPRRASSSSSSSSEISEDVDLSSLQEEKTADSKQPANASEELDVRRIRSKSDGAQSFLEPFEIYPNLPDDVLEKMDLLGPTEPRERMSEEEVEQKFVSLALAFSIDAATIKNRCDRQRRYRDQTETNLSVEIDRLVEKLTHIQPLCVNAQTTEILTNLLEQVDVVTNASNLAAISAERFGAVQHEERLSESVHLMISHVSTLKQQRDSARRHLQYTKKVLQDTHSSSESTIPKQRATPINGKLISKRRASIATICEPHDFQGAKVLPEVRKITRRISDFSLRACTSARTSRPSRLELGLELVKIKEGSVDESTHTEEVRKEENSKEPPPLQEEPEAAEVNISNLPIRHRLLHRFKKLVHKADGKYREWVADNTLHEIFCFSALMCFSLGIIILGNVFIELECAKRNTPSSFCFYSIGTLWTNFYGSSTSKEYNQGYVT